MLKYDWKRAFAFRYMCLCPLLMALAAFVIGSDSVAEIWNQTEKLAVGWTLKFVIKTLRREGMQFLVPIFAVLPFSADFVEECKFGMIKNVGGRVGKREYLYSKAVTAACAGGMILVMGALVFGLISCFLFGRLEAEGCHLESVRELIAAYVELLFRYFMNGALWAELGLLVSAWLNHPLMAWLSPFMVYYLLIIFYERYFPWCHILYPREWILAERKWPLEQWSLCLWLFLLTVSMGCLFYQIGKEVFQNV